MYMIHLVSSDSKHVEAHDVKSIMCFDMYRTSRYFCTMMLDTYIYDTCSIIGVDMYTIVIILSRDTKL